jgi:subtilisin family serine protease
MDREAAAMTVSVAARKPAAPGTASGPASCLVCGAASSPSELADARWLSTEALDRMAHQQPRWRREDGACPACVQHLLLEMLLEKGEDALHESVQRAWPLDAEAAFAALPTPLRLHAHPRYTGAGVTLGLVDAAFYPHPDLTRPRNRIRAWVDASREPARAVRLREDETPRWPRWDAGEPGQWHGLMTSAVAAGNGALSHGLCRGLAPDARLVLVQVRDVSGRITNESIARALDWLRWEGRGSA